MDLDFSDVIDDYNVAQDLRDMLERSEREVQQLEPQRVVSSTPDPQEAPEDWLGELLRQVGPVSPIPPPPPQERPPQPSPPSTASPPTPQVVIVQPPPPPPSAATSTPFPSSLTTSLTANMPSPLARPSRAPDTPVGSPERQRSPSTSDQDTPSTSAMEQEVERLERKLYDSSTGYREFNRIIARIDFLENKLAQANENRSGPRNRRRETLSRRGNRQDMVTATSRENLRDGDHRTTTTTRTTTTVRKGRRPVTQRTSNSTSVPLESTSHSGSGATMEAYIEELRRQSRRRRVKRKV